MLCEPAEKQAMVVAYWPLVKKIVAGMFGGKVQAADFDDLVSDGVFGLADAIDKFDPDRGVKFATFASRRIRGAILDGMRDRDWVPRLERKKKTVIPAMNSLNSRIEGDAKLASSPITYGAFLEDETADHAMRRLDARDAIMRLMQGFDRDRKLAMLLYHIDGMTMKEIGVTIGLSESRVSQIISDVMHMLRTKAKQLSMETL